MGVELTDQITNTTKKEKKRRTIKVVATQQGPPTRNRPKLVRQFNAHDTNRKIQETAQTKK